MLGKRKCSEKQSGFAEHLSMVRGIGSGQQKCIDYLRRRLEAKTNRLDITKVPLLWWGRTLLVLEDKPLLLVGALSLL